MLYCGTSCSCSKVSDNGEPIRALKDLSDKKFDIKFGKRPLRPISCKSFMMPYLHYTQQHELNTKYSQTLEFALQYKHEYCSFLSSPLALKQDISVTILLRCMCVHVFMHACVYPSGFVWVITPTFMHGFQNYVTKFLFLRRSSVF